MNVKNDFETVNFRVLVKLKYFFEVAEKGSIFFCTHETSRSSHCYPSAYTIVYSHTRKVRRLFKTLINRRCLFSNTKQIQYKDDMFDD